MFNTIKKIFFFLPVFGLAVANNTIEQQVQALTTTVNQLATTISQVQKTVDQSAKASVAEQMGNIADAMKQGVTARIEPSKELVDAMKNLKVDTGLPSMTTVLGVSGALLSGYYFYKWCQKRDSDKSTGNATGWAAGLGLAASILTLWCNR